MLSEGTVNTRMGNEQRNTELERRSATNHAINHLDDRQRLRYEAILRGKRRPNDEVVSAVIAGFLLEHVEDFIAWVGDGDLKPAERRDCFNWIFTEVEKNAIAQRRAAWSTSHWTQGGCPMRPMQS